MATKKKYFQGLGELANTPELEQFQQREFPEKLPTEAFLGDEEKLWAYFSKTFTEPMMAKYVRRMSYLNEDGEISDYVDDHDFIEWAGAHFEDLHEDSRWGDGWIDK